MRALYTIIILFAMLSCNSDKQIETVEDSVAIDSMEADGTITDTADITPQSVQKAGEVKIFKGLYSFGNEVSTFRECENPSKLYWLEDKSKKLSSAYKKATEFLSYPYESVYIEVKGYLKGKSNIGYAEEYENVLIVTDLISLKPKSYRTECFNYEFICLGNEPFWSLDILPDEKLIALKDVGSEKTYTFPYSAGKIAGNRITFQTSNDKKETLKAVITRENCSDGMSDRVYSHSAEVTINGKTLKGCAIKKGDSLK